MRAALERLAPLWRAADRPARLWLAGAAACVAGGALAAGLAPLALKQLVDSLAGGASAAGGSLAPVALYVSALALQRVGEQGQAYAYGRGEQRLVRRLSAAAYDHMLRLPLGFHLGTRSGALAQSVTEGVLGLRIALTHLVQTLAPVAVQLLVGAVVVGAVLSPGAGAVLACALVAYAAVFALGTRALREPAAAMAAAQLEGAGLLADGLMNVEAAKVATAEPVLSHRYDQVLAAREAHGRRLLARRLRSGLAVVLVFAVTLGAALQASAGASVGDLVLVNAYVLQLVRPLEMLGFAARDIGQAMASLQRLLAVLANAPEPEGGGREGPALSPGAELVFDRVSLDLDGGRRLLREVSFRARPGQTIAIVGPSGAGKSSLLRLILRLHAPSAGEIRLDGRPLQTLSLAALRRQIAVVSQDTILFNDSLRANIALGSADPSSDAVAQAARAARLGDLLARLPDGLDTPVGERGLRLSGGEKQRVAIARAILRRARLVLLDEATAALDPETEQAVWASARGAAGGATVVVVSHRLQTIAEADQILVLDRGRIAEAGAHGELLAAGGLYARLWRAHAAARPVTETGSPR